MADYKSTHTGAEIDAGIDKAVTSEANWKTLMANLGIGRWKFHQFQDTVSTYYITDNMLPNFTNCDYIFYKSSFYLDYSNTKNSNAIVYLNSDFGTTSLFCGFYNIECKELYLSNMQFTSEYAFAYSTCEKILIKNGCSVSVFDDITRMFWYCGNLVEIGEIDLSKASSLRYCFGHCGSLKTIHCKHFKVKFDISASTAFEEADLVEIISNLDPVTTAPTLTMGATNLAKLTDAEKQVATDKGWVLA